MKNYILSILGTAVLAVTCSNVLVAQSDPIGEEVPTYSLNFSDFGYLTAPSTHHTNHSTVVSSAPGGFDISTTASFSGGGWQHSGNSPWSIYSVANTAENPAVGLFTWSDAINVLSPITFGGDGVSSNPYWSTTEISISFYHAGVEVQYSWQDTGLVSRKDESGNVWITSDSSAHRSVSVVPDAGFDTMEVRIHNTKGNSSISIASINFQLSHDLPPIPEPSTYAAILAFVSLGAIVALRRRK